MRSVSFISSSQDANLLSSNSRHTVVGGSGHESHLVAPDVVVQAITDVLEAVRAKTKLPMR